MRENIKIESIKLEGEELWWQTQVCIFSNNNKSMDVES
mgnify:FL=1